MNITYYKQKKKNARRAMDYLKSKGRINHSQENRLERTIRNCSIRIKSLKQQREKISTGRR